MELAGAGSGGHRCYDSGGATVLARKRVDLNTAFLDGVRRWSQVQNTLTNSAGHVEAIDNILVVIRSLAVGAGVNRFFRGKVIRTGSGRTVAGTRCSQSRHPRGQSHQRYQVAALEWQLRDSGIIQR